MAAKSLNNTLSNYSYVTNKLTNKSNNNKYNQKIGMTKTENAHFFEIVAGQLDNKKIAHIEKEENNLILKFDQDFFNCVKFNDDNFSDSDLGKLLKKPLKLNASVSGSPSIILKEKTSNELILSVICDNEEQLSITFNALGVSINQNGNIHKGLLDKNQFPELSKENCTNTFNMSTNFFEEILKGNVDYRTDKIKGKNDAKLTDYPPFLWGLYFDLIEFKKDKNDFYENPISDTNLISYELDGAKYAFVKKNNDVFFYSRPNNGASSLKQINVNTNKNNRHEVWLYEDNSKNKFLVVGYSTNSYLKLPIPDGDEQAQVFLNNFNEKICNIHKDNRKKNKYYGFPVYKKDPRKMFEYKFGVRGTSDEFDFDEDSEQNNNEHDPKDKKPEDKKPEDKKPEEDKKDDDEKKDSSTSEEPREYKFNTKFYGDMFTTLSFFALIAAALLPGIGALFIGLSMGCMAGAITSYAVDGYKLSIQPSIKKIKNNDYTKFKTNDKSLQKDLENLKVSQKVMQDFIAKADENSFTKQFVDLYNENGLQKEHLDFAQKYSLVTGTNPDLKTLMQLENFRNETNPEEKNRIKEEILSKFDEVERTDKEQQLFGQSPLFDIEQLNVQQDINQDLEIILNKEDKDEKIKLQNSFIEKYLPSVERENLEITRASLFDNKKDIKEFNFNLEHLINSEKLIINDKERTIKLIEKNNIDYLINLFSNRDEKECTKMFADYGEVVARRFAYGKNLSQVELKKFIKVLPKTLQEDAINYISLKFDNIDKAINLLHEKIEKNVDNEKALNETYNFIEILLNSKNQQSNKDLNNLSEELRNKISRLTNDNNISLTNALIKIVNDEDNNIHKRICSILSIKNFEISADDLSIKVKHGEEKSFSLDIENFKTLIENKKKENNENSTRECLVLSKVLGEDFIKNEISTLKSQDEENENETTSGEISEDDKKYQNQEKANKDFTEIQSTLNKDLSKLEQNLNSSTMNKTDLNENVQNIIDKIDGISEISNLNLKKKKIESLKTKLEEFKNNNDVNKSKIRKTIKEIRDLLSSIEKKNNKSLTKTNKKLVSSQNLQKLPTGKQVSKNIKTFNLDNFQSYINQNLDVNVNEYEENNENVYTNEDEREM